MPACSKSRTRTLLVQWFRRTVANGPSIFDAFLFDSDIAGEKVKNMRQMLQESHSCSLVVRVKPSDRVELLTLHELLAICDFLLTGGIAQLCTLVNQDHLKKPVASRGFKKQRAGAPKAWSIYPGAEAAKVWFMLWFEIVKYITWCSVNLMKSYILQSTGCARNSSFSFCSLAWEEKTGMMMTKDKLLTIGASNSAKQKSWDSTIARLT